MTETTLSREFIEAFGDDEDDDFDPRYCVGNSHALIVCEYSATSARCACGSTLVLLTDGRWVHPNSPSPRGNACPPCDCACGRRHNVRPA